jgi:hypothetical protein
MRNLRGGFYAVGQPGAAAPIVPTSRAHAAWETITAHLLAR